MPLVMNTPYGAQLPPAIIWDLTGFALDSAFDVIAGGAQFPTGFNFSYDGTKAYVIGLIDDTCRSYSCSTPFDFSTGSATYDGDGSSFSVSGQTGNPKGMAFSRDGLNFYVISDLGQDAWKYDLGIAWDVSSAVYNGDTVDVSTVGPGSDLLAPQGLTLNDDGTRMYVTNGGNGQDGTYQFELVTPYELSSAVYEKFLVSPGGDLESVKFNDAGTQMLVAREFTKQVHLYDLSTAWDIATAILSPTTVDTGTNTSLSCLAMSRDGNTLYALNYGNSTVDKWVK